MKTEQEYRVEETPKENEVDKASQDCKGQITKQ